MTRTAAAAVLLLSLAGAVVTVRGIQSTTGGGWGAAPAARWAAANDALFHAILAATALAFLVTIGLLVHAVVRQRGSSDPARARRLEYLWTVFPAIVLVLLGVLSFRR